MDVNTGRFRDSRLAVLPGAALLAMVLSGCAGQAAMQADGSVDPQRQAASSLYAGQPAAVHATEFPVVSAAEGIERGDQAWRQGQLDLAIYLYIQSLAFDGTNPSPFLKIGAIHEHRGNRALAAKAFEQALKLGPANAAAMERLGLLYLQDGRDDDARALLERATVLDRSRWQSHNGLGIAADRREDFAVAIRHYDAAIAVEPRAAMVVNNRGYSRLLAGDFVGAEADFRTALNLGSLAGTWTNLGMAQARQGRYAEALESLLKEHDAARAHNLLGEAALQREDLDTAQSEFVLALAESPRYFEAAQENLDLVGKRIAERAMQGPEAAPAPIDGNASTARAGTGVSSAGLQALSSNRVYARPGSVTAAPGRKVQKHASSVSASASCVGATATKPRCSPVAVKRQKPYRLVSTRRSGS